MLRLITGRIRSGKTTEAYNKIKSIVSGGGDVTLIVPEQYSFRTEKNMLELLGAQGADRVQTVSFSFLADFLLKRYGENSLAAIDDSTRALMMSLALESVGGSLEIYGRHRYSAAVISQMLKTVKELRQGAVTADMLRSTADGMKASLLKSKLCEIALVYEAYSALVEASYFDSECSLDKLCGVLDAHGDFKGKTVFVDGFRGFTAQELKVLERILRQADDVYVTLCCDREREDDEFGAFSHTLRTRRRLIALANKNSVAVAVPEYMQKSENERYSNGELAALERGLYSEKYTPYSGKTENIVLCCAEDIENECDYVAHTVKKLIRTENLRCRDIAVVSRSEADYARRIRAALKKNGVPVFEDRRQPIASQPLVQLVCGGVEIAVNGFSCENVMRVLKTGLTDLTVEEIAELENYALMWQINGLRWLDEWTLHPDGLGKRMSDADALRLAEINRIRAAAAAPLRRLCSSLKRANGLEAAKAVYRLLTDFNASENLKKLAVSLNERGDSDLAAEQNRIWDVVIEILDRTAASLSEVILTPKRFAELLNLIVSVYTLGSLPQGLDEVAIGSADRVKAGNPKVVFAVGMNDGVFPAAPESGGMLSENELKQLALLDLNIDDSFEEKMTEERFIAYSTLCIPYDKLFVTYAKQDCSGAQMTPSELVTQLHRIFPGLTAADTAFLPELELAEGEIPAFEQLARLTQKGGAVYASLEKYFSSRQDYKGKLAALRRAVKNEEFEIKDKDIAKELFGFDMYMSASRAEVYHKCPFEYFCKYGLNAQPAKIAELDPLQKGTAIHYILEKLIAAYGSDGLCAMEKSERDRCVISILEEYFNEVLASGQEMGERFGYLFRQLGSVVCEVVDRLAAEFSVSEFKPVAFEMKIDRDGEVETYDISLPDGGVLHIKGSVDRVDVMESGGEAYVRVVDYKSGGKRFDLNEAFSGLNMQMLIYLFAIWKNGFRDYKNIKPAGVLYMPVNAPYASVERGEGQQAIDAAKRKSAKMNGMVLDDSRVVYAMDSRADGEIIPAKIKKDGACSGTLISLKQMGLLMKRVEKILADMAVSLHNGVIKVYPAASSLTTGSYADVCKYCDYCDVCRADENAPVNKIDKLKHEEALQMLGGEGDA